jgi:DNA invertase Pin-like site-specific DNA recombinase
MPSGTSGGNDARAAGRATTAPGRLVFHMFGALAEFERTVIRERTQAGLAAARRAGRTGGRPPKLTDDDIEAAQLVSSKVVLWCFYSTSVQSQVGVCKGTQVFFGSY